MPLREFLPLYIDAGGPSVVYFDQHIIWGMLPFNNVTLSEKKPASRAYPKELKMLGDHIRKKRLDLGISQGRAAKIIGVAKNTLIIWENNHRPIAVRLMPRIVAFLGYDPS